MKANKPQGARRRAIKAAATHRQDFNPFIAAAIAGQLRNVTPKVKMVEAGRLKDPSGRTYPIMRSADLHFGRSKYKPHYGGGMKAKV